ncbi:Gpi17 [Kluyveromyces lactis]|nr:Gpi17 [Kluyveromyces lactis]
MSTVTLRRLVTLSFVLCYVLLGVPLWFRLTTIYRAPLPAEYIESLHANLHEDIHLTIPVYVQSDIYNFPDVCDAIQRQADELLKSADENQRKVQWSLQILPFKEGETDPNNDHVVKLVLDESMGLTIPQLTKETIIFFNDESLVNNDLPFFVAQALIEHTFKIEWEHFSKYHQNSVKSDSKSRNMAVSYDPNIHISISLLTGDAEPIAWDIDATLKEYFTPIRDLLSPLVNFTVDTGIEYHNDLNLHSLSNAEYVSWNDLSHTLDLSDLFSVNHYREQNSINLAIVFPSVETGSLAFINKTGNGIDWKSFLVPQWGVVVINKDPLPTNAYITGDYLADVISTFAHDIFKLLGLSEVAEDMNSPLVRIDSFKRKVIIDNLEKSVTTLSSLVSMTNHLQQMSIPREVLEDVNNALNLRLQIVDLLNNPELGRDEVWNEALRLSNRLVKICERAFFHKEMVQQTFFPQEHKIAVYLPLLGPITVVTFTAFFKSLKEVITKSKKEDGKDDMADDKGQKAE